MRRVFIARGLVAQARQIDYTTVATFVLGVSIVIYFVGRKAFRERKRKHG
jgi:hypothetical protein